MESFLIAADKMFFHQKHIQKKGNQINHKLIYSCLMKKKKKVSRCLPLEDQPETGSKIVWKKLDFCPPFFGYKKMCLVNWDSFSPLTIDGSPRKISWPCWLPPGKFLSPQTRGTIVVRGWNCARTRAEGPPAKFRRVESRWRGSRRVPRRLRVGSEEAEGGSCPTGSVSSNTNFLLPPGFFCGCRCFFRQPQKKVIRCFPATGFGGIF